MKAAAGRRVIISEPIRNLTRHPIRPVGWVMNRLTDPGGGDFAFRYTEATFREFAESQGAREILLGAEDRNAIAIFET
jgi:hypothetical protein